MQRMEKLQVFLFLFQTLFFIEVPDLQFLIGDNEIEKVVCVNVILVDFVEILCHLCGLTAKNAQVGVAFQLVGVQFGIDVNQFEK